MADAAFTILEITTIAVPLIAIVVFQIFSSNLDERMPDDALRMVGQILIVTGFLFIIGLVFTLDAIVTMSLSQGVLIGTTALVLGLSLLTIVVLVFPMYLLASSTSDTEQKELSDVADEPTEQDLGPQSRENTVETQSEPNRKEETE